jgi:hypothetical protein
MDDQQNQNPTVDTSDPNLDLEQTWNAEHNQRSNQSPLDQINELEGTGPNSLNAIFEREKAKEQQYAEQHRQLPPNPEDLSTYKNMPLSEVGYYTAKNLVPSFGNAISAIPHVLTNPFETAKAIGQIGTGFASKIKSNIREGRGEQTTPEQAARDEQDQQVINKIIEPFSSWDGFKKALVTDPFSVISLASIPLTAGGGAAEEAGTVLSKLGEAGTNANTAAKAAGNILSNLGTGTKVLGYAADPLSAGIGLIKGAGSVAGQTGPAMQHLATGAPQSAFEKAYQIGKQPAQDIKDAFNEYASGRGDPVKLSQDVSNAVDQIKSSEGAAWKQQKKSLVADKANQDVPYDKVLDSIQEARNNLGDRSVVKPGSGAEEAHNQLDSIEQNMFDRLLKPNGDAVHKLDEFDKWKQSLWNDSKNAGLSPESRQAFKTVHSGVKGAISEIAPEYEGLMDKYQSLQDKLNNIQKMAANGNKVAANNQLAALLRLQKTSYGTDIIDELGKVDPKIPAAVAGAALQPHVSQGFGHQLIQGASTLGHIGAALSSGDWKTGLTHILFGMGQIGAQDPNLMGKLNYAIGSAAGSKLPTIASGLATSARVANPLAYNIENINRPPLSDKVVNPNEVVPFNMIGREAGGRVGRKDGGRIKSKNHDKLVARLFKLAEEAKRHHKKNTEVLLNEDDNTVAKALDIANRNI